METGRPHSYTPEVGKAICKRISAGESLRKICRDPEMPGASTVFDWLYEGVSEEGRRELKDFSEQYAQARETQAELMFEEINEIADDAVSQVRGDDKSDSARVQAYKLRVDARKWTLSKMLPKKYGDKLDVTSGGKVIKGNTIVLKDFDGTGGK